MGNTLGMKRGIPIRRSLLTVFIGSTENDVETK